MKKNSVGSENQKSKIKNKKSDLEKCQEKIKEYLSGWQRAQADYQNLKKHTDNEKQKLSEFIKANIMQDFFPLLDNFETALKHVPQSYKTEDWYTGFEHLEGQFNKILNDLGVERILTKGQVFDENIMEAITTEANSDFDSGQVIKEVSAGYTLNKNIIKPAKVIVAE